jgi:hypothetical protein
MVSGVWVGTGVRIAVTACKTGATVPWEVSSSARFAWILAASGVWKAVEVGRRLSTPWANIYSVRNSLLKPSIWRRATRVDVGLYLRRGDV